MIKICAGNPSRWLQQYRGCKPTFACILSFTETGLIPQISAAGKTPSDRRYTAALDGNYLLKPTDFDPRSPDYRLPALAAGISPAVMTRAMLQSLSIPCRLLSTGLPAELSVPHIALPKAIARSVTTGNAMPLSTAEELFAAGQYWGEKLAPKNSYLIIGECVVGGTTTAQAVLTALGYSVAGRMSSSLATANHSQKQKLVAEGLSAWREGVAHNPTRASALGIAAAVGDPMQLVAAGMAISASQRGGVLLAGGAQMLAVYALASAISEAAYFLSAWQAERVVVGTTRWVIRDQSADVVAIARQTNAPLLASQISFSQSPYMQLRAYEQGFVKEGVGAGGCAIAAQLYQNWTQSQLRHVVEAELRTAF
ncbi:MAG: nicotinate mononucleotide-dependent phosphoribosyltransferase CobT [Phormidesmis sp.]